MAINCAEACINGCVLGERCPNLEYKAKTTQFINETSLDKILEIAEDAVRKKRMEPPKWILPEEE